MNTLFVITSTGRTVVSSEAKQLFPQLKKLSVTQIKYLILAYDTFNTLFKHYPYAKWRELACQLVYNHNNIEEIEKPITKTIEWFKELQNADEKRNTKIEFENRKRTLLKKILSTENPTDLKNLRLTIEQIDELILSLDNDISKDDDNVSLAKKGAELTILELWQRKQKHIS